MVRFIIYDTYEDDRMIEEFTFQYGQIYYALYNMIIHTCLHIYIPIWLDLLYVEKLMDGAKVDNLHSNMVRFIIFL